MERRAPVVERVWMLLRQLPASERRLVVGVSGGPDSMALLHILCRVGARPAAAHVDYRLRGAASAADRRLVERTCAALGVPLAIRRATDAEVRALRGAGMEDKARALRYAFFREQPHDWIVTAHHREDQVETFFLNLLRGAGTRGLAGMRPIDPRARTFRPLLETARAELLEYCAAERLRYRVDRSNEDETYTRNRVRARLIPLIESAFGPAALAAVFRATRILEAEDELLDALAREREPGEAQIALDALAAMPLALRRRVIRRLLERAAGTAASLSAVESVLELASRGGSGRRLELPGAIVERRRGRLEFASRPAR